MPAQRYTSNTAISRMEDNKCPECGNRVEQHGGLGGGICSLTDNGVADRIHQYQIDLLAEQDE